MSLQPGAQRSATLRAPAEDSTRKRRYFGVAAMLFHYFSPTICGAPRLFAMKRRHSAARSWRYPNACAALRRDMPRDLRRDVRAAIYWRTAQQQVPLAAAMPAMMRRRHRLFTRQRWRDTETCQRAVQNANR